MNWIAALLLFSRICPIISSRSGNRHWWVYFSPWKNRYSGINETVATNKHKSFDVRMTRKVIKTTFIAMKMNQQRVSLLWRDNCGWRKEENSIETLSFTVTGEVDEYPHQDAQSQLIIHTAFPLTICHLPNYGGTTYTRNGSSSFPLFTLARRWQPLELCNTLSATATAFRLDDCWTRGCSFSSSVVCQRQVNLAENRC